MTKKEKQNEQTTKQEDETPCSNVKDFTREYIASNYITNKRHLKNYPSLVDELDFTDGTKPDCIDTVKLMNLYKYIQTNNKQFIFIITLRNKGVKKEYLQPLIDHTLQYLNKVKQYYEEYYYLTDEVKKIASYKKTLKQIEEFESII